MNNKIKTSLIEQAQKVITNDDPSHDFLHAYRVMRLAEEIAINERGDMDVVIPAALFHDVVNYPKNNPKSKKGVKESAEFAKNLLIDIKDYPQIKISKVVECIKDHSFTKGVSPSGLEAKILQDADRLDATGAIAIMRTFSSAGQMRSKFYNESDPFCKNRFPEPLKYATDLFYTRLLKVGDTMHTNYAKKIATQRTKFVGKFLDQLRSELKEIDF